ncbi:Oxygen regulatory protein NreC [Neomoorella glycerini]|uniref:Stage 0 sporulation protein A homolog n=1 Tax=Neomoorella glycerini TaxID=55779 RepID=A0A6I5ZT47_9FIRM|nr:response regulator transcription factor [Moorella glycerini]QGP93293.1 Oxygen regulatory protein NreC [Moorella glycerini]
MEFTGKIRIVIADDHSVVRAGLRYLINAEADMQVVGEAVDGDQAIKLTRELSPHVLLLDISMPFCNGFTVVERIAAEMPPVKVLVLSMHEDREYVEKALASGAAGYIVKRAADNDLITAIRVVYQGGVFIHPLVARFLVDALQHGLKVRGHSEGNLEGRNANLTSRETEVLRLVALGYTNHEIAEALGLSIKTVESHKGNISRKLNLTSRAELVRYALQQGLIPRD